MTSSTGRSKPRALIIAPQPFFSPRGTPFSVYYRTLILAELGVEADLLTYGEGMDVDIPGVRIVRIPRLRFLGSVRTGPSWLKLLLDQFVFAWTVALLVRRRYDFVHAHEEAVFFCTYLKRIFGFRLIYDMHSSLPQQLSNFDFSRSRIVLGIFDWQERRALTRADAVITICPELADYATSIMPDPGRHILIENSIFDPVRTIAQSSPAGAPAPAAPALDEEGTWVVYAGTLETYQGIDLLVNAFPDVLRIVPQARLLIAGGTPAQVAEFSRLAKEQGITDHCVFSGRVAQETVAEYMRRAALTVSPRNAGTNTPLKIYQQMASGVPLVATRILSHTQVLDEELAILVQPDAPDLARGIILGLSDRGEALRRAGNAQRRYSEYYSRDAYVAKMRRLLARLLPSGEKLETADV